MRSQQIGLAGLFPRQVLLRFWGGKAAVCSWVERSPTLTPSPSHPTAAGLSPQSPEVPLSLGHDVRPCSEPGTMGRRAVATMSRPTLTPYYPPAHPCGTEPSNSCPRNSALALAFPVASPSVSSGVGGPRGYLPGTNHSVSTEILSSGLQMSLENNNSFLNPRKERAPGRI